MVSEETLKDQLKRDHYWQKIDRLFNEYDFLAMPSAQVFPFDKAIDYPNEIAQYKYANYHQWMEVSVLSSLLGLPTISIPVGFNSHNLPMGIQIIGRKKKI